MRELVLEGKASFQILAIDLPEGLNIDNQPGAISQNRFAIKFRLKPENIQPIFQEEVYIRTSADPKPLRIPVYAVIKTSE